MKMINHKSSIINRKSQSAFTLIELLIVIVIIGVLSTILVSNFIGVRQRARDSQRKADLRQIQTALELYREDQGIYPTGFPNCPIGERTYFGNPTCIVTYMQKIPTDPKGTNYYYNGNYYYTAPGGTTYTLCACLENANDNQGTVNPTCGTPIAASFSPVVSAPLPRLGLFSRLANLIQGSVNLGKKEVSSVFSKLASLIPKSGTPKTSVIPQASAAQTWAVSLSLPGSGIYSLTFDSINGVIYAGTAGATNGTIYRCAASTGCALSSNWTVSLNILSTVIYSLAFDSINGVIYAGTGNGHIYRCAASTGCTTSSNWTVSFNTQSNFILSLAFDSINGVIYAGTLGIYRCAASTGCTTSSNWTVSLNTPSDFIYSLTFDSINGVIYAGTAGATNGTIYRCAASTGCALSSNWTVSLSSPPTISFRSLTFDSINGVIYAGTDSSGIYRCAASTGCALSSNWTFSLSSGANFVSLTFDSINGVIYAGTAGNGIYRCAASTGCTTSSNWTVSLVPAYTLSLTFDSINGVIYAGTDGAIYRSAVLVPTPTPTPPILAPSCAGKFFFLESQ